MLAGKVAVILISHHHLYTGVVQTHGYRLLEMLNNADSDYIAVQDARIYRAADLTDAIAAYDECVVRKASIHLALITSEEHEAPQKRLYAFVPKRSHAAFLCLAGYEVQGHLHLATAPDVLMVLASHSGDFLPVTQAVVSHASWDGEPLAAPVALAQKASLSLLRIEPTPVAVP